MSGTISLKTPSGGVISLVPTNTASNFSVTVPAAAATMLGSTGVTSSTTNTVTNKIAVNIAGTTYYLLASTSST